MRFAGDKLQDKDAMWIYLKVMKYENKHSCRIKERVTFIQLKYLKNSPG